MSRPGACAEKSSDVGCRLDHLLEVVEDQQRPPRGQILAQDAADRPPGLVRHAEGRRDRGEDERRIAQRIEGDEPGAVGVAVRELARRLDREPGLAGPAGTDRASPSLALEQIAHLRDLIASGR